MTTMGAFGATVASEWTKLRSLRATWITLAIGLALGVGLTAVVAIVSGATWDDWEAVDRADFQPALLALGGMLFSSIPFAVVAVNAAANEYASGMIRLTLTATPRRGRVLLAKAAVIAAVTLVASGIALVASFLVAQAVLGSYDVPTASLGDAGVPRLLLGGMLTAPVMPVIGVALGFLLRSKAGGITAVLALAFLPLVLGPMIPGDWQEDVLVYLPASVGDGIVSAQLDPDGDYVPAGLALLVLAGWVTAFVGAAHAALSRRDA
jgi:ABC-2 type transport system permease protein